MSSQVECPGCGAINWQTVYPAALVVQGCSVYKGEDGPEVGDDYDSYEVTDGGFGPEYVECRSCLHELIPLPKPTRYTVVGVYPDEGEGYQRFGEFYEAASAAEAEAMAPDGVIVAGVIEGDHKLADVEHATHS